MSKKRKAARIETREYKSDVSIGEHKIEPGCWTMREELQRHITTMDELSAFLAVLVESCEEIHERLLALRRGVGADMDQVAAFSDEMQRAAETGKVTWTDAQADSVKLALKRVAGVASEFCSGVLEVTGPIGELS